MTKNCTIDKVKIIMQAGIFNTMSNAVSKFVNSCTEATGQPNTIPYYKNYIQSGETADVEITEVTFVVVIIITTTMVPNTIMHEANIEETIEAVATRVEATTIITKVMSD